MKIGGIEKQNRKQQRKNKIYFIWKLVKDSYLCTPNRKEGKIKSSGGCHGGWKTKRLKRVENTGWMNKTGRNQIPEDI